MVNITLSGWSLLAIPTRVALLVKHTGLGHDSGLLVLADALLEEVGLALERDVVHEVEGVLHVPPLGAAELLEEAVGHELDVARHEAAVHADERDRQGVRQELGLDGHRLLHDAQDVFLGRSVGDYK